MSIYLLLVSIFSISEVLLLLSKRSKSASSKSQADKRSLLLFWITIPVCFVLGDYVSDNAIGWPIASPVFRQAGIAVFTIGFIIRWISIYQLGKMFTVDVAIVGDHRLKNDGLYSVVRHPSYLGLVLIILGISMFMSNLLSCIVVVIPIFLATNYRISVEEKALTTEFGAEYEDYKRRVKKIIPGIY
jgi:protein-S-isoprenylcysteine O-methyltransferase Ste14